MATKEAADSDGLTGDFGLRIRMRGEERRITSQHEKLKEFGREVYLRIDEDGPQGAVNDFMLFAAALDAHMTVEEDIFFPALHGLRPVAEDELARLVAEHGELRVRVEAARSALERGDAPGAIAALDSLTRQVSSHEEAEEALIANINEDSAMNGGGQGKA